MKFFFLLFLSTQIFADFNREYPYHLSGTTITFPQDEGAHPGISALEWWYTVMHVKGKTTGHEYSILITHFSNEFRFFNITDLTADKLISATTQGKVKSKIGELNLSQETPYGLDTWVTTKPFEYDLFTHGEKTELQTHLTVIKEPLRVAKHGISMVGSSGITWYYSFTRMEASGKIKFENTEEEFSGIAWFDHQWGPFLISPVEGKRFFETYEWFCVQLDNGEEFMISNIFDRAYHLNTHNPAYGGIGWSLSDGTQGGTLKRNFSRTGYYKDPKTGNIMSMGWKLEVPELSMSLDIIPSSVHQLVDFPYAGSFWEGASQVVGTRMGKLVHGKAFGELIHRYEQPKVKAKKILKNDHVLVKTKISNPDDGAPLLYDLEVFDESNKSIYHIENSIEPKFHLSLDFKNNSMKVTAHSIDHVISGEYTIP